jgi:hypothetical protein
MKIDSPYDENVKEASKMGIFATLLTMAVLGLPITMGVRVLAK